MISEHSKYTKTILVLLVLNSISGLAVMIGLAVMAEEKGFMLLVALLVMFAILSLNTFAAWKVYLKSFNVLKYIPWLYGAQILGIETKDWEFYLNLGLTFNFSIASGSFNLVVNVVALVICLFSIKALRSTNLS